MADALPADPGHNFIHPGWDSPCSCSEVAVKGKKCKVNMQRGLYKFRSVYWLLTYVRDYENRGKSVQRFIFIQIALFLSCFHVPIPSPRQSNHWSSVEGMGSELGAAVCCPSLLCYISGVPREAGVETCQFWLLLPLWTPSPAIQIKRIINQRMPK